MVGINKRPLGFKFRVKQEYEVIIYYEDGIAAQDRENEDDILVENVLDLAFNNEGLVLASEESDENSNGYIGLVTTFDPELEEVYSIKEVPAQIKQALAERGLLDKK
jgi:hypothetical protein